MADTRTFMALIEALAGMADHDAEEFGQVIIQMISDGPPASVAFLQTLGETVWVPLVDGVRAIRDALDDIPTGELLSLAVVFSEMADNKPARAPFLGLIGREMGAALDRRQAERDTFDQIVSGFDDA